MVSKTLLVIIILSLLCITTVSAWEIKSDKYVGTVTLYNSGTGTVNVQGYGAAEFAWAQVGENQFEAYYWFYTVPFTYHPESDTITSTATDAILVR
jgi:hypothetical protein